MKKPESPKERNLLKGAMRRIFSRSDLRKQAISNASIEHRDDTKPRVTRWVYCESCGLIFPAWQAEVDHKEPIIPIGASLEDLTWDQLVESLWCHISGLAVLDKECHKEKSAIENQERRRLRKVKNEKSK